MDSTQILNLRKKLKFSQEQLAHILSVSSKSVSRWENNGTSPKGLVLQKLQKLDTVTAYKDTLKEIVLAISLGINNDEIDSLLAKYYPKCRKRRIKEILR